MNAAADETTIVLLTGIPATGKSTYGRWLEKEKGFLHLDVEAPGVLDRKDLRSAWDSVFLRGVVSTGPFVDAVIRVRPRVAIDWGFPPDLIEWVRDFGARGVKLWWFDGDRAAARRAFISRGTVSVAALDRQMVAIGQRWEEIRDLFEGRIITAIDAGGSYMPHDQVFHQMFEQT